MSFVAATILHCVCLVVLSDVLWAIPASSHLTSTSVKYGLEITKLTLNSSVHDLRLLTPQECSTYYHPPKPSCHQKKLQPETKLPVFMIQWKLNDESTTVDGFCFHAENITMACDYRVLIYSYEYIKDEQAIKWLWVDQPTQSELKLGAKSGFLDPSPPTICSFGRYRETTHIRKRVFKCSLHTTSSGVVTDTLFYGCDLRENGYCVAKSGIMIFRPSEMLPYSDCPVLIDHIDLGILEGDNSTSKEIVTLTATTTKRLFYWSGPSISSPHVCMNTRLALAIYKDDGGYLVSMETLDRQNISPSLLFSDLYINATSKYHDISDKKLKKQYEDYMSLITVEFTKKTRRKRSLNTTLSPLQALMRATALSFLQSTNMLYRKKRDIDMIGKSFSGPISDLQLSFLRSEVQHDFKELTGWLNDRARSLYLDICNIKLRQWMRFTMAGSRPENLVEFNTGDPNSLIISKSLKTLQCTPSVLSPNKTFSLPIPAVWNDGKIHVYSDSDNKTFWLHPHLGILSDAPYEILKSQHDNAFLLPFKDGCSVDLITTRSLCPTGGFESNLNLQTFLHNLGPMYNPTELASLIKTKSQTVYQAPIIPPELPPSTTEFHMTLDWLSSIVEPFTRLWKFFSPNMWSLIYLTLIGFILLKALILWSHRRHSSRIKRLNRKLEDNLKKKEEELELAQVSYNPLIPSHISPPPHLPS